MGRGDDKKAAAINQQNANTGGQLIASAAPAQNTAITDFTNRINDIFAKNPYTDPTYLANVRSAASNVESGAQNAGNTKLEDYAARTGENSSNVMATEEEGARESARRQHGILTDQAIQDYGTRQQQLMSATAMQGQVPGMYNPQLSAGEGLSTGAGSSMTQLAGQPSWYDSLINAGISAAGAAVGCAAKASTVLMFDGTRKAIEELILGELLMGADGLPETLLRIEPRIEDTFEVICYNGASSRCSGSHTLARPVPGYVVARDAQGQLLLTEMRESSPVVEVRPCGKDTVFKLFLDRSHTYLADQLWSME